mmetsp:Transcript_36098/g.82909  ORF Transcript_36098/g.82909 Transcript_36098/m.82909 type:complete len:426 (+) Transcript_36098:86-1363(+)
MDPAMMQQFAALLGGKGGGKGKDGGLDLQGMLGNIWDNPMVTSIAFHPSAVKAEYMDATSGPIRDGVFEVFGREKVSYRLYLPPGEVKVVVYLWHGNAETCTTTDYVKDVFAGMGAAVLSLDYRGYSWGTGKPSLTMLCGDAEACFAASLPVLEKAGCASAKKVAMGRSIGATCAVHIASKRAALISGLIVESGLMSVKGLPMVANLGPAICGGEEGFRGLKEPFDTYEKMTAVSCPTLVLHGKQDEIVPFSQGSECHSKCASKDKTFKEFEDTGHNNLLLLHQKEWAEALKELFSKAESYTEPFPAGSRVEAHSLSVEALNGQSGCVLGPAAGGERYRVEFADPHGEKALKPDNLKLVEDDSVDLYAAFPIGSTVEAHSLSNNDFNGLRGTVLGPQQERVSVQFPDPQGVKALKPANLKAVSDA